MIELRQVGRQAGLGRGDNLSVHTLHLVYHRGVARQLAIRLHCCNPRLTSFPVPQTIPVLTC